jgi:hypothetical protein
VRLAEHVGRADAGPAQHAESGAVALAVQSADRA